MSLDAKPARQYWQEQFERWQQSGLSKADFCRQEGLKSTAFYYWSRRFTSASAAEPRQSTPTGTAAFLPVTVHSEPQALKLQIADVTLSCSHPVSAEQLAQWIRAIRNSL